MVLFNQRTSRLNWVIKVYSIVYAMGLFMGARRRHEAGLPGNHAGHHKCEDASG